MCIHFLGHPVCMCVYIYIYIYIYKVGLKVLKQSLYFKAEMETHVQLLILAYKLLICLRYLQLFGGSTI